MAIFSSCGTRAALLVAALSAALLHLNRLEPRIQTVPVIELLPNQTIASVLGDDVPVVLRNSVVTRWPSLGWTPSLLGSLLKESLVTAWSRIGEGGHMMGPYFALHRPLAELPAIAHRRLVEKPLPYRIVQMPAK